MSDAFGSRHPVVEFDGSGTESSPPQAVKERIDAALERGFGSGSRAAVVRGLDRLHGQAALMFHAYCDNENAEHRRVAIVFTVYGGDEENSKQGGRGRDDRWVEGRLGERWAAEIGRDKLEPLLARIGNSNVFVSGEAEATLTANGC